MHRSPTFLFLYLPWISGVVLMVLVLINPLVKYQLDQDVYQCSLSPLSLPSEQLVRVVSISPRFPGCNKDSPDRDECASQRLEDYLYGKVSYPAKPNNEYNAGLVVVSFNVRPSGRMEGIALLREPGYGRGADALRIIRGMVKEDIRWEPATVNGKATSQRVLVKIRYSNFRWVR